MIRVAAVQIPCSPDMALNTKLALDKVREAAENEANIILLPELFESPYFCKIQESRWFEDAWKWEEHPVRREFEAAAKELNVVLPVSYYEKDGNAYFNSIAVIDADGTTLGIYRKLHIPQGPGYEEKYYFSPGNLGIRVWDTRFGGLGWEYAGINGFRKPLGQWP